jgi:hypothetical protein
MRTIRRDPKIKLEISAAHDTDWQTASTADEFVTSFTKLLNVITDKSGASMGEFKQHDDGGSYDTDGDAEALPCVRIEQTLSSAHGTLIATLEFVYRKYNDSDVAELLDEDARPGSGFPELSVEWKSNDDRRLKFATGNDESLWFAIGLLESGLNLSEAQQAWVKLNEKNVWLVNYTIINPHKSDTLSYKYGLRSDFSEKRAREFLLDK